MSRTDAQNGLDIHFNIRFIGPKTWNLVHELLKQCSRLSFEKELIINKNEK